MMSPIGWTYNEKSCGPRTEPCGTPVVRVVVLDDWSPITTRCVLCFKYDITQSSVLPTKSNVNANVTA